MKTAILEQPGRFAFADTAEPGAPGPGEALVRVLTIGICGTDLHAFEGTQPFFNYPRILGHELAVEVVEMRRGWLGIQTRRPLRGEPVHDLWGLRGLLARADQLLRQDAGDRGPFRWRHARPHPSAGPAHVQMRAAAAGADSTGRDAARGHSTPWAAPRPSRATAPSWRAPVPSASR